MFIASLARKHRTQNRNYFLLLPAKGAKRPLRGGETSRGRIIQGAKRFGAKRPGGELTKGRNVHKSFVSLSLTTVFTGSDELIRVTVCFVWVMIYI